MELSASAAGPVHDAALQLAAGDARVELAPATGGAVTCFTLGGGDVLRPTSPAARVAGDVRGHACYPLVPYSNRIAMARLRFAGAVHDLGRNFGDHPHSIHGVGWQRPWHVVTHDRGSALIAFEHVATGAGWPWPFRATQALALTADGTGATLEARLTLANTGDAPFPFGLGFHPFFPRTATTELCFRATSVWNTDATQLPTQRVSVPERWRFDRPRAVDEITLDNVFAGWDGSATLRDRARHLDITIAGDSAASFLVVYVPPGRDFLAVEPVTHMTDAFNRAERGESGTGTRILAGGAAFSCTMRISAHASP
jgi:aldose 1-epimerase